MNQLNLSGLMPSKSWVNTVPKTRRGATQPPAPYVRAMNSAFSRTKALLVPNAEVGTTVENPTVCATSRYRPVAMAGTSELAQGVFSVHRVGYDMDWSKSQGTAPSKD